uniref:Uncharacterized protein n=1 Tax=Cacopsylla melanoneura TaxID=428564 RepID=A0A8D9BPW9_9HEMI
MIVSLLSFSKSFFTFSFLFTPIIFLISKTIQSRSSSKRLNITSSSSFLFLILLPLFLLLLLLSPPRSPSPPPSAFIFLPKYKFISLLEKKEVEVFKKLFTQFMKQEIGINDSERDGLERGERREKGRWEMAIREGEENCKK